MLSWMGRTVIDLPLNEIADFIAKPESALIFDKYIVVSITGLQWNLRIKDNLGPGILSLVQRLVSLRGQPIFSLKMPIVHVTGIP